MLCWGQSRSKQGWCRTGLLCRGRASCGTRGTGGDEGCRGALVHPTLPSCSLGAFCSWCSFQQHNVSVGIKWLIPSRAASSCAGKHSHTHGHELRVQGRTRGAPATLGPGQGGERGQVGVSHVLLTRIHHAEPTVQLPAAQRLSCAAPWCCGGLAVQGCSGFPSHPKTTCFQLQDQSEAHSSLGQTLLWLGVLGDGSPIAPGTGG